MLNVENFKTAMRNRVVEHLFKSLFYYKDHIAEYGNDIFSLLFYNRDETQDQIKSSFKRMKNAIIIGNPGEGKSTLMHHMFLKSKKVEEFYSIIIDEERIFPKSEDESCIVIYFINELIKFYKIIGIECKIEGITNTSNYKDHYQIVARHFIEEVTFDKMKIKKKLIVFIDDFDYLEEKAIRLIRQYFLTFFSASRGPGSKCCVIISGRKLLANTLLKRDRELRVIVRSEPREIHLNRLSIKCFVEVRLKSLFDHSHNVKSSISDKFKFILINKLINIFKLNDNQRTNAKNIAEAKEHVLNFVKEAIKFDFSEDFYINLGDVTGRNLRDIESMLPLIYKYNLKYKRNCRKRNRKDILFDFDDTFCDAYIDFYQRYAPERSEWLVDILSHRITIGKQKNYKNSILQIILEYFYHVNLKDDHFFYVMSQYGIKKDVAEKALNTLSKTPYTLLDPEEIYQNSSEILENKIYKINRKGRFYIDNFVNNEIYINLFGNGEPSTRSYMQDEYDKKPNI